MFRSTAGAPRFYWRLVRRQKYHFGGCLFCVGLHPVGAEFFCGGCCVVVCALSSFPDPLRFPPSAQAFRLGMGFQQLGFDVGPCIAECLRGARKKVSRHTSRSKVLRTVELCIFPIIISYDPLRAYSRMLEIVGYCVKKQLLWVRFCFIFPTVKLSQMVSL
jgi:hypothetical protein